MIAKECVERIKDSADIVSIVGEFTKLKRVGANYVGCCPFHSDRKPSFSVSPSRNICKCFSCGKGGDPIGFLMEHEKFSYVEALEWIAERNHIHVVYERNERTQEQIEQDTKKESMLIAMQLVQRYFVEQFFADNPEAEAAREYAYGRWPNTVETKTSKKSGEDKQIVTDNCKLLGLGYAPKDPTSFFEYVKREGISIDILLELGVLKASKTDDSVYPFFRERITMPIYNRWSKVIGYTARYIGSNTDVSKYLNTPDSMLFKKGEALFGYNVARRHVAKAGEFIVVEGAPDAMRLHLVGLEQAVAPLGTALTEQQLDMLHRDCKVLRFIPDSEPPKGEQFSPGDMAVMRHGALAMQKGFEVYVREIPRTAEDDENDIKYDPDTFITESSKYDDLDDVPFVVWLAQKKFKDLKGEDKRRAVAQEIAELFVYIADKSLREYCQEQLNRIYHKPQTWKKAINAVVQKALDAEADKLNEEFTDKEKALLRKHGIIIKNYMYYSPSNSGDGMERWSNFILRPGIHVKDKNHSFRTFRIVNEYGNEEDLELSPKAFSSIGAFQQAIEGLGAYVWLAKQEQLNKVKEYIFPLMPLADNIVELGWHQQGQFFAFADGIHTGQVFIPIDDKGIVRYNDRTYYLPAFSPINIDDAALYKFERQLQYKSGNTDSLGEYVERMVTVFGEQAKIGFAWMLACLFRDHIHKVKDWFPLLNIFGIRGSGKTALAKALASFFYVIPSDVDKLEGTTVPAMTYTMSHLHNGIIILDEYSNLLPSYKIDMLKGIWGGNTRSTMNSGDSGGGIKASPVYSGVIFCGQHQPSSDNALFTRCVHLTYSRTNFTPAEILLFDKLKERSKLGNAHLTMEILRHRKMFVEQFAPTFTLVRNEVSSRLSHEKIDSRILENWVCILTAFRVLETVINVPFSYAELFEICIKGLRYQQSQTDQTSETADFWSLLNSMHMVGKCIDKTHYVIKYLDTFQAEGSKKVERFGHTKKFLYLNWDAVKPLLSQRGFANLMKMDAGALDNYLRTSPYYLGIKQQRFTVLTTQGYPDTVVEGGSMGTPATRKVRVSRPRAMVFDYEALQAATNIDLETVVVADDEVEHEEAEEASKPEPPKPEAPRLFDNNDDDDLPF